MRRMVPLLVLCALLTGCAAAVQTGAEQALPGKKLVALTFDDGPGKETTEALLEGLKERGVPATFFLIGEQISGQEELVRRMRREGHQIGNHTWSHQKLSQLSQEQQREEIRCGERALEQALGTGSYWLRPPYGFLERTEGLSVPVVLWSVDPRDWESRDAAQVTEHVLSRVQPGDIILLHDLYPSSVEAALAIADTLQAQGWKFVTVEQLLEANGTAARAGQTYRTGYPPA